MDAWDAEGNALDIYRRAGLDPADPPKIEHLARRLFGVDCITTGSKPFRVKDASVRITADGRVTIYVSRGLSRPRRTFAIAHEIAEWYLRAVVCEWIEHACDQLGAALLAPRQAFLPLYREVGLDLRELAETFETTETCVGLRIGETTGTPIALLSPAQHRLRGEEWGWPAEIDLRRLARSFGPVRGLRRVQLADDPRRVMLVAEP